MPFKPISTTDYNISERHDRVAGLWGRLVVRQLIPLSCNGRRDDGPCFARLHLREKSP